MDMMGMMVMARGGIRLWGRNVSEGGGGDWHEALDWYRPVREGEPFASSCTDAGDDDDGEEDRDVDEEGGDNDDGLRGEGSNNNNNRNAPYEPTYSKI